MPTPFAHALTLVLTWATAAPTAPASTPLIKPVEGPERSLSGATRSLSKTIDPAFFQRRRRSAIGLLFAAGAAGALAFGLRGLNYWIVQSRCAPNPGVDDGSLPTSTLCPRQISLQVLSSATSSANTGLFALTVEGSGKLGRLRADRVHGGLIGPLRAKRRMAITMPLAYFSAISVLSLGFLIFYDNATTPTGTKFLEPPTRQPAFDPLLHFGAQTMMTATALSLGVYLHARAYSQRADDLELTPLASMLPGGGATLGLGGRF